MVRRSSQKAVLKKKKPFKGRGRRNRRKLKKRSFNKRSKRRSGLLTKETKEEAVKKEEA